MWEKEPHEVIQENYEKGEKKNKTAYKIFKN